jgi:hypothetical protein
VEIEVALDALSEASAIAHWGVVTQCCGKLCKFAEVLSIKLELVRVAGKELEVAGIQFCKLEVKGFLPMLLGVVIRFDGALF